MEAAYHRRRRIGDCDYEIRIARTQDDRVELTVVGWDADGQLVAELSGALPSQHRSAVGALIKQSAKDRSSQPGLGPQCDLQKAYDVDQVRKVHPNAYAPWTDDEESLLARLCKEGLGVTEIAVRLGRGSGGVRARLAQLGLATVGMNEAKGIYEEFGRLDRSSPQAASELDDEPPF